MAQSESQRQVDGSWLCVEHGSGYLSSECWVDGGSVLDHRGRVVWLLDVQQTLPTSRCKRY